MENIKYLLWFSFFLLVVFPILVWGVRPFTIMLLMAACLLYYINWLSKE